MAVITPPVNPADGAVHLVRPGSDPLFAHAHHHHGVCWKAVFAGALAAAALSLILLMLGLGLGFSAVSPWARDGASADTLSTGAIVWISLMSLLASGVGGYMAGRLRRTDPAAGLDEEHFRDTANGFLSWALATLLTAGLLSSAIGSLVGGAARVGGAALGGAATSAAGATAAMAGRQTGGRGLDGRGPDDAMGYTVDTLFRAGGPPGAPASAPSSTASAAIGTGAGTMPVPVSGEAPLDVVPPPPAPAMTSTTPTSTPTPAPVPGAGNAEATRILVNALSQGSLSATDRQYLAQLVAQRAGVGQAEAERRVDDAFARLQNAGKQAEVKARTAADGARKAARNTAFWTFFSLLLGAFAASAAALLGSRHVIRQTPSRL